MIIRSDDDAITRGYGLLREGVGEASIAKPGLIRMGGSDCREWLQGQATNDLRLLSPTQPVEFCLCSATGQIEFVGTVWEREDHFLVACPAECGGVLLSRVEEMVIMEEVEAVDLSDGLWFATVQGPLAAPVEGALSLPADRCGFGGYDVWSDRRVQLDLPIIDPRALEAARLEARIPALGTDITRKSLPPELGPRFERSHVSYSKGCYMGQEVLQRIHSRGHVNKVWTLFAASGPVEPGAVIDHVDRAGTGSVSSCAFSPRLGWIAAGTIRTEHAGEGAALRAQSERGEVDLVVLG